MLFACILLRVTFSLPERAEKRGDLKLRKLKPSAVPSTFPNLPSYLSKKSSGERSKTTTSESRRKLQLQQHEDDVHQYFEEEQVTSLSDITEKFSLRYALPQGVILQMIESSLVIYKPHLSTQGRLEVQFNVTISENLEFEVFCSGIKLDPSLVAHICKQKITSFGELFNIITFAKNYDVEHDSIAKLKSSVDDLESCIPSLPLEKQHHFEFLVEQLQLATLKDKRQRRYSVSLLSMAVLWENCSPALYSQLLSDGVLCLPSRKRIHDLTQAFNVDKGLSKSTRAYLKARSEKLLDREKIVMLQEDEIYSAKRVEYAEGKVTGLDTIGKNGTQDLKQPTKTMLCIMVKSIAGNYFDVVALYPVGNLDSSILKRTFDKVIPEIVSLGFKVVANGLDAYSANRKFYIQELCHGKLQESVEHESQPNVPIHLLFDAVHVFKNIYCNFLNRKQFVCPPFESQTAEIKADVMHIVDLYKTELGKPGKKAYKLTDKVLNPHPIERTKVALADSFFHESTIAALEWYAKFGNHPEWAETASFLKIIRKWWNIVNVRTAFNGQMKRDETKEPIRSLEAWQLHFLKNFADWLTLWQSTKKMGLTSETFLAARQTSRALQNLAIYLLQNGIDYVLLGLAQSDSIENRFGWYRNLNGSNYYVSVRQILSAEKAIRVKSLLHLSKYSLEEAKNIFKESEKERKEAISEQAEQLLELTRNHSSLDLQFSEENSSTAFYLAGYCVHSLLKRIKCKSCSDLLMTSSEEPDPPDSEKSSSFLDQINRGGLITPSQWAVMSLAHSWAYYDFVVNNEKSKTFLFTIVTNQADVFVQSLARKLLEDSQTKTLIQMTCHDGHSFQSHFNDITRKMFNISCKNLVTEINSEIHSGRKRSSTGPSQSSSSRKLKKLQQQ